ncbi:MAG: hypothetical protein V3V56_05335 [bacterium]
MLVQPVPIGPSPQAIARGGGGSNPAAPQAAALQILISAVQSAQSAAIIAVTGKGSGVNTAA